MEQIKSTFGWISSNPEKGQIQVSDWFGTWLASVAVLVCVAWYCDRSAALRGTKGCAPPMIVDKGLRLFFFVVMVAPSCLYFHWLTIPYLLYLPFYLDGSERRGGRPSERVANWGIWHWFKRRFSLELIVPTKLDPSKQYVFGLAPHGILPLGGMINFLSVVSGRKEKLPGIDVHTLAASFVFYIPLYRDLALAGGVCDASRYSARALLEQGKSILLVPGGATEALYARPKMHTLVLKKRLGFVKLAIQTGASLVPAYSFGENDMFDQLSSDYKFVHWMKTRFQRVFGISLPLLTNIWPHKCKITTVVGKPIETKKNPEPSTEEVRAMLDKYTEGLRELFDEWKDKYAPDRKEELNVI